MSHASFLRRNEASRLPEGRRARRRGLSLADYLRLAKAGEVKSAAKAKAAIYIRLGGGPTHMDTFDLKPDAPAEYRGELKPIKTNVAGMEICEKLPLLAKCADKFTILRGVSHTLAAHELGTKYMLTGNRPLPSLEFPAIGSVVSKELPVAGRHASVRRHSQHAARGRLPRRAVRRRSRRTPRRSSASRSTSAASACKGGMTLTEVDRREKLLATVDTTFRDDRSEERRAQRPRRVLRAGLQHDQLAAAPATRSTSSRENPKVAKRFGDGEVNQSSLLAVRLIEAGARFVTLTTGSWDMHTRHLHAGSTRACRWSIKAVSALLDDARRARPARDRRP